MDVDVALRFAFAFAFASAAAGFRLLAPFRRLFFSESCSFAFACFFFASPS
jgi:hypothetical protein